MSNFYLNKYGFIPPQISLAPNKDLGLIVVIPCYNEPDVIPTLTALAACETPIEKVEVIIVVNSGENTQERIKKNNLETITTIEHWNQGYNGAIDFYVIHQANLPKKHAGVGLARKIGMDEAVSRFHQIEKDGIVVCFDADSQCSENYLSEIEAHFKLYPSSPGCSIHYEHPIAGDEFNEEIYQGIINYELHLRYYNQCLRHCDLPYAYHTVGSSMAVRSSAYQKQGGMNKRKAGEDFYFIHKIIALGNFTEIKNAQVIPSPRISDRVPFGTGKAIGDWIDKGEEVYYSYNFSLFKEIKLFVSMIPKLYENDSYLKSTELHPAFIEYFENLSFVAKLQEMKSNTKDFNSFEKRFFVWFDAFQVLKLIHYMQKCGFEDVELQKSVNEMLIEKHGQSPVHTEREQLLLLRQIEKS